MCAEDPDVTLSMPPMDNESTAPFDEKGLEETVLYSTARKTVAPVGQIGEYEILSEIARGGMGIVYKARHRQLGRMAAVKLIKSGEFADADEIRRFQVEAEAAAGLDHPGIVSVYEVVQQHGQYYLALAYVDGVSLWQKVKESPLPPREAARLMQQVSEAIQFAHDHGIIHRDLKPQNILLTSTGQPKVTDFGLAKKQAADSNLTATGQILGTPSYMPPEQVSGNSNAVGTSADVYALGATLYCLLTGRPPFQAATPLDTMLQVLERNPVPPRQLNPTIPRDLETICLKCLEKTPERRYPSAAELKKELERYLNGEPIVARSVGRFERFRRWCRRNPLVAALSATAVLLLVSGTLVSTYFAVLASRRAARAEEGTRIAIETLETVIFQMQDKFRAIPAARAARIEVLKQAMKGMQKLSDLKVQSGRLDFGRGVVLTRFAAIIFDLGSDESLGTLESAEKYLKTACDIYAKCAVEDPHNRQLRKEWAFALVKAGDVAITIGKLDRARELTQQGIHLYRELRAEEPDEKLWKMQLTYALNVSGDVSMGTGDFAGAFATFREARELIQPLHEAEPDNADYQDYLIVATEKQADAQLRLGDAESARQLYEANLVCALDYSKRDPTDPIRMYSRSFCYERLAEFEIRLGDLEKAAQYHQQQLESIIDAIERDPKNKKYQEGMELTLPKLSALYQQLGRTDDATTAQARVQEIRTRSQ